MGVLCEVAVVDLGEVEHAFDDAKDMLHATADLGLDTVTSAPDLAHDALVPVAAVREVVGPRRLRSDHCLLTLVGRVAPHLGLFAMKEIGLDRGVMDVGSGGHYGVNPLWFCCRRLCEPLPPFRGVHAKKPLVTFLLGLVHVVVAFSCFVLCR